MKLKLLLIVVCLGYNMKAIAQVKFGFELNAYSTRINNISPDTIEGGYGHSGAKVTHSPSYRIAPVLILRKDIGKNFGLETGLGYWSDKYKINLNYINRFTRREIDTDLNISLKYIQVPVLLNYEIPMKGVLSFLVTGGIRSKILIYRKDNYEKTIIEEIGFPADFNKYKRIVLAPTLAIAGKWELNKGKSFELGVFGSRDATPFTYGPECWGFYNNLYPARSVQSGVSLKFFL